MLNTLHSLVPLPSPYPAACVTCGKPGAEPRVGWLQGELPNGAVAQQLQSITACDLETAVRRAVPHITQGWSVGQV